MSAIHSPNWLLRHALKSDAPQRLLRRILTAERVTKILQGHDSATLVVSSVVPKKNRGIKRAAGNRKVIWLTSRSRLNIRIDYPDPKSIGADRLANAVAVAKLYGTPAIVIDFGTAVTFDIVAPDNAYIGGVIAPGLEAMTNFLYDRTALLPRISLREPRSAIGKSTNQAMVAGAIFGYRGLVREILQRITAEKSWKDKVRIVATGGYAKLIARKLPEVDAVHENLTLEGLRVGGLYEFPVGSRSENLFPQAVEMTCQGHPAIVLFSPSMKILKFAAVSLLVFGTIAANNVAPSNWELEAMYDKAYRAFDAANYMEALKQLDAIDARKPDLAASQNLRGVVYMRQGLYEKAEAALSEARGLDPKFWNARFNLAEIPFLKKDWAEARKRFQELLTSHAAELQGEAAQLIHTRFC